jgi:hypothetical protein
LWFNVEDATSIPALSSILSPIPIIPPLQTVTFVLRTFRWFANGLKSTGWNYFFVIFFRGI